MRVTVLDMRDSQQQCPDGLKYPNMLVVKVSMVLLVIQ